jgi:hypothetical protein
MGWTATRPSDRPGWLGLQVCGAKDMSLLTFTHSHVHTVVEQSVGECGFSDPSTVICASACERVNVRIATAV